jgi:D-glycero-alpha-D-manno-heptose 1-phosphate guanylyltransferase
MIENKKFKIIILAGGLGTRLRSAVPDLPKPMANIRNRPFLEYLMDYWIEQGVQEFILSIGYLHSLITEHFGDSYKSFPVKYVIENNPLGTGGGLIMSAQGMTEPFLVVNGDTFIEVDLEKLSDFHFATKSEWTFSLFVADKPDRYKRMKVASDGRISSFQTGLSQKGHLANGGVYLINPSVIEKFDYKPNTNLSLEDELLPNYVSAGGLIYGVKFAGKFIDIGVPDDLHRARNSFFH